VSREDPPHVTRLFGPPTPRPVDGCPQCAELDRARRTLREIRDESAVTDTNIALRDHQARAH
jgi:hypothetical protein